MSVFFTYKNELANLFLISHVLLKTLIETADGEKQYS